MSCGCTDKVSFDIMINEAKNLEIKTGIKHIVYIRKVNNKEEFFLRTINEIDNIKGVKEYFLTDKTVKSFPTKTQDNLISKTESKKLVKGVKVK